MEIVKMKYYPKEVYYEVRGGANVIVLNYGDSKVEHVIAAQQGVHPTLGGRCVLQCTFCGGIIPDHNLPCPAAQSG